MLSKIPNQPIEAVDNQPRFAFHDVYTDPFLPSLGQRRINTLAGQITQLATETGGRVAKSDSNLLDTVSVESAMNGLIGVEVDLEHVHYDFMVNKLEGDEHCIESGHQSAILILHGYAKSRKPSSIDRIQARIAHTNHLMGGISLLQSHLESIEETGDHEEDDAKNGIFEISSDQLQLGGPVELSNLRWTGSGHYTEALEVAQENHIIMEEKGSSLFAKLKNRRQAVASSIAFLELVKAGAEENSARVFLVSALSG